MPKYYKYNPKTAKSYKSLGIQGTSYEASFHYAAKLLGNLKNKIVLDFGSGAGRSAKFLVGLGAKQVIGVDHNEDMVKESKKAKIRNAKFHLVSKIFPLKDNSVDLATAFSVFMEMADLKDIETAIKEIARVLKPESKFIIKCTNPKSVMGHNYVSYEYIDKKKKSYKSGDKTKLIIKTDKPFIIEDYYWKLSDYKKCLKNAGFAVKKVLYPKPASKKAKWLDEIKVSPDIIIEATKK